MSGDLIRYAPKGGDLSGTFTALAPLVVVDVEGYDQLFLAFTVGVAALSQFVVEARGRANGVVTIIANAADHYVAPDGPILGASAALNTAAIGGHFLCLDVAPFKEITIRAAGTSSTIAGDWSAS